MSPFATFFNMPNKKAEEWDMDLSTARPNRLQIKEHKALSIDRLHHLIVQYDNIGAIKYLKMCKEILNKRKN
tara:strand:+ start:620 stop:835 length:216 start_codon:yes stop_codon:yes gene_type:complete